jgi:hypothetical protein
MLLYLLAPFGANSTQRQLSQRLCVDTGQTGRREIPAVDLQTSPGQDPVREMHVDLL